MMNVEAERIIEKNVIYESILTVYALNGKPHATPMGFSYDGTNLIVRPYIETRTFKYLRHNKEGVINLVSDSKIFLITAFKDELGALSKEAFIKSIHVNAPRLRGATGYIDFKVIEFQEKSSRATFICKPISIELHSSPFLYTRAFGAVIEMLIYATKLKALYNKASKDEVKRYLNEIYHAYTIIEKVASNSCYMDVAKKIMRLISKWKG